MARWVRLLYTNEWSFNHTFSGRYTLADHVSGPYLIRSACIKCTNPDVKIANMGINITVPTCGSSILTNYDCLMPKSITSLEIMKSDNSVLINRNRYPIAMQQDTDISIVLCLSNTVSFQLRELDILFEIEEVDGYMSLARLVYQSLLPGVDMNPIELFHSHGRVSLFALGYFLVSRQRLESAFELDDEEFVRTFVDTSEDFEITHDDSNPDQILCALATAPTRDSFISLKQHPNIQDFLTHVIIPFHEYYN